MRPPNTHLACSHHNVMLTALHRDLAGLYHWIGWGWDPKGHMAPGLSPWPCASRTLGPHEEHTQRNPEGSVQPQQCYAPVGSPTSVAPNYLTLPSPRARFMWIVKNSVLPCPSSNLSGNKSSLLSFAQTADLWENKCSCFKPLTFGVIHYTATSDVSRETCES